MSARDPEFQGISRMSERTIELLTEAVHRLTIAVDELTQEIRSRRPEVSAPVSTAAQPSASSVGTKGSVKELTRVPFPEHFVQEELKHRYRTIEEGAPPVPVFVLKSLSERLTEKEPGSRFRAESAYKAGFWARAAIDTCTRYVTREIIKGLKPCHWVVLRSDQAEAFRTTSRSEVDILCRSTDSEFICEGFASLAEVETFCLGAGVPVPVWKTI